MLQEVKIGSTNFNVFMGFDGFVDTILKPMREKTYKTEVMFQTLQEFSAYLDEKNGKSCSIDMEHVKTKIGGNVPIVANALGNLGCHVTCIGAFGFPEIHPIFNDMSINCELNSVVEPGYCNSLEFTNGKLMLAMNYGIDSLDYKRLTSVFSEKKIERAINESEAVAFLNWGELLYSNDIWKNILIKVIPKCTFEKKKIMLVDFSDFSKRSKSEVEEMLAMLHKYSDYFDITVSVNENEMDLFLEKLNQKFEDTEISEKIVFLAEKFHCKNFVLHMLDVSYYVSDESVCKVKKEVVKNPKIITGGGDNFNAGLLLGLLLGFDIEKSINMGAAMSCLYVKKGRNVKLDELEAYMIKGGNA